MLVEEWKNVIELPEFAKDMDMYPKFVNSIRLDDMPKAVEFGKDIKMKSKLAQLQPLFESPLTIQRMKDGNGVTVTSSNQEDVKYVLVHPNGKTIQDIIQDKLNETSEEASKGDIQGGTIEGLYDYNKCHFAEIKYNVSEKGSTHIEQDVIVLSAESPTEIFVCPTDQIGLAEDLQDQIRNYVAAVGDNYLGAAPIPNHLCIAKSVEDEQWYRAVCYKQLGDDMYELMFVDYGNVEIIPRKNIMHMAEEIMKTPLLASHCVLEGFEEQKKSDMYKEVFGDKVQELLPVFEDTKIMVIKKIPKTATYVVRIPHVAETINAGLLPKDDKIALDKADLKQEQIPESVKTNECDAEVDKILSPIIKNDGRSNVTDSAEKVCSTPNNVNSKIVLAKSIPKVSVSPGNSIIALGFAEHSNKIYVQRLEDAERVEEIGDILKTKCTNKSLNNAPKVGELVACKWSDDNELYRAEVLDVLKENKIYVRFVDYGNAETEALDHVMELPQECASIPFLASLITLEGVPSFSKPGNPTLCDLLQEMEAQLLEDILEVVSINNDKYVLKHENGKSFNESISKELEKEGKKEITSDENKKELTEKLKIEAGLQKAEDDKRKELEEQIRKMQEMLSQMSK